MKITVLGCSGSEMPGHNAPGFLLEDNILFDAGSLTNILNEKRQRKIESIFITHAHLDHIKGIPFLADNLVLRRGNRKGIVTIYSLSPIIRALKSNLLNNMIWPDFTEIPTPGKSILKFKTLQEGNPLVSGKFSITPYRVHHSVPAVGYLIEGNSSKSLFYTGDTGPTDATWKKIGDKRLTGIIIEASFPNRMEAIARKTGHLTARLLRRELAKLSSLPKAIYITHTKPQHITTIKKEIASLKIPNIRLLHEGQTISI